ncbi:Hypothetical Protein FCC1311_063712 [Hondaea fermentalgiana]|uniref:Uncharacterized protein n=1 Tax=Hondaea fermentalgiana TaxID=2315210 RepID=A0A2R5GPA2_9STRA|nr:Hypothetical Protein FCC1311_063712 [Hondaea fermentalgiana]|eukprot:GBG30151.1 Hypothetical Protein FCC1311_063712 [Hondaea fermentalgiana]
MVTFDVQPACGPALWGGVEVVVDDDDISAAEARTAVRDVCGLQVRVAEAANAWLRESQANGGQEGSQAERAEDSNARDAKKRLLAIAVATAFPTIAFPNERARKRVDPSELNKVWEASQEHNESASVALADEADTTTDACAPAAATPNKLPSGEHSEETEGSDVKDPRVESKLVPGSDRKETELVANPLANAELWFCKKPFQSEKPLKAQVSISSKTKLRVYLAPGDRFDACSDDAEALKEAASPLREILDQVRPEVWVDAGKSSGEASVAKTQNSEGSPASRKRPREAIDLSFMNGRSLDAAVDKLCDDMGFRLKSDVLARLDNDAQVQNYMRDPRLVGLLVDIEKAPSKMKALEDAMDRDASFARFVDLMLTGIGAQRVVAHRDGPSTIESSLEEVIETTRPSFLLAGRSDGKANGTASSAAANDAQHPNANSDDDDDNDDDNDKDDQEDEKGELENSTNKRQKTSDQNPIAEQEEAKKPTDEAKPKLEVTGTDDKAEAST